MKNIDEWKHAPSDSPNIEASAPEHSLSKKQELKENLKQIEHQQSIPYMF